MSLFLLNRFSYAYRSHNRTQGTIRDLTVLTLPVAAYGSTWMLATDTSLGYAILGYGEAPEGQKNHREEFHSDE
jgi:hypothetical protein